MLRFSDNDEDKEIARVVKLDSESYKDWINTTYSKYHRNQVDRGVYKYGDRNQHDSYQTSLHEFDANSSAIIHELGVYIAQLPKDKQQQVKAEIANNLRSAWKDNWGLQKLFRALTGNRLIPASINFKINELMSYYSKTSDAAGRKKMKVQQNLYRKFLLRMYKTLIG